MKTTVPLLCLLAFSVTTVYGAPNGTIGTRCDDVNTSITLSSNALSDNESMTLVASSAAGVHGRENLNSVSKNDASGLDITRMYAQAPPDEPGRGPGGPGDEWGGGHDRRFSFRSKLMMITRLVDELEIGDTAATEFVSIFLKHSSAREKLEKELNALIVEIYDDTDNKDVSTAALKKKLAKIDALRNDLEKENDSFLKNTAKILDDRQYIKLAVFEDKLRLDLMNRFRRNRRGDRDEMSEEDRERVKKFRDDMHKKVQDAEEKYRGLIEESIDDDKK